MDLSRRSAKGCNTQTSLHHRVRGGRKRSQAGVVILLVSTVFIGSITPTARALGQATWVPPYTAEGVDYDSPPDGLFDFLMINGTLDVAVGGHFIVFATFAGINTFADYYDFEVGLNGLTLPLEIFQDNWVDGPYSITLEVRDTTYTYSDQVNFTTGPFLATEFEDDDAVTGGTPTDTAIDTDIPPNGLFDALAIDVPVTVFEPGRYGVLLDYLPGGFTMLEYENWTNLLPGPRIVRVDIPGYEIWKSGVSGNPISYRVALGNGLDNSYITAGTYTWSSFEPPPVVLNSTATDWGIDTDVPPDGKYDALRFRVPVDVNKGTDARLDTFFQTSTGETLDNVQRPVYLFAGPGYVDVDFGTRRITELQVDGPYRVIYSLYDADGDHLESAMTNTAAYLWSDFNDEPLPAYVTGPITDAYVDLDTPPDGLVDRYVIRVPVQVNVTDTYVFKAFLRSPSEEFTAVNRTLLSPGATIVNISRASGDVDPGALVAARVDAETFEGRFIPIPSGSYTPTPPPGPVAPPLLQFPTTPRTVLPDVDGDGLYDSLNVEMALNVSRAGTYLFSAFLASAENNYRVTSATNTSMLDPGTRQVTLTFLGWAIRASYLDGPYGVFLSYREWTDDFHESEYPYGSNSRIIHTPILTYDRFGGPRPAVAAGSLGVPASLDGAIQPGEWDGATLVDLRTPDPGLLAAKAYVANDGANLYVALDAVGDVTNDTTDAAALAFDVGALDDPTPRSDDVVGQGGLRGRTERVFRMAAVSSWLVEAWDMCSSPAEPGPPERADLSMAMAFAPSPNLATPHRTYEFRIPLSMLKVAPGDSLGIAVHSWWTRGLVDGSGRILGWPVSLNEYYPLANIFARLELALVGVGNEPPAASFTHSPANAATTDNITFNDTSIDSDGSVVSWLWDFGDGNTSIQQNPTHRYAADGTYNVTLRVTDDGGAYSTTSMPLLVENAPPDASFSITPMLPTTADEVAFTDTSTDPGGSIVAWQWDFGDGSTSSQEAPTHRYADNGTYTVGLTVVDDDGANSTTYATLVVENLSPNASFTVTPRGPTTADEVAFDDTSSDPDGAVVFWSWDFGDGTNSSERHPRHRFLQPGTYNVTLLARDDDGKTAVANYSVTVVPPPSGPGPSPFPWVWPALLFAVLVALAGAWVLLRKRRAGRETTSATADEEGNHSSSEKPPDR